MDILRNFCNPSWKPGCILVMRRKIPAQSLNLFTLALYWLCWNFLPANDLTHLHIRPFLVITVLTSLADGHVPVGPRLA